MDVVKLLFGDMNKEQLDILLPCIDFHIRAYDADKEIEAEELWGNNTEMVAIMVTGRAVVLHDKGTDVFSDGKIIQRAPQVLFKEPSTIILFDKKKVKEPCWFSCFFHWKFIENFNKIFG